MVTAGINESRFSIERFTLFPVINDGLNRFRTAWHDWPCSVSQKTPSEQSQSRSYLALYSFHLKSRN